MREKRKRTEELDAPLHVPLESPSGYPLGVVLLASFEELVGTAVSLSGIPSPSLVLVRPCGEMRLLTGHSDESVSGLGIKENDVIVIHGSKTLKEAANDEGVWRGRCHPQSAKVLLKVGFKVFDDFPVLDGDPASLAFWARARNGLACTFGSKSPNSYLKMWLRFQQLFAVGHKASLEHLDVCGSEAKLLFADFLHIGTIGEVVSIFTFMESCHRVDNQGVVGADKRARRRVCTPELDECVLRSVSKIKVRRGNAETSSVLELRWRQLRGGLEMEKAIISEAGVLLSSPAPPEHWPSSDCNYIDHVIVLGENLTFKSIPFPFENRFDAVCVRLIVDGDHPARGQRGLFATQSLEKDEYIGSYAGARLQSMFVPPSRYQFDANHDKAEDSLNDYLIDALRYGNETRFMNSIRAGLKMPNQNVTPFCYEVVHEGICVVCVGFKASRQIHVGEELLVNYGDSFCWEDDSCGCRECLVEN